MTEAFEHDPPFIRVHGRQLSLWQSAVARTAKTLLASTRTDDVLRHPLMRAVTSQILILQQGGFEKVDPRHGREDVRRARLADLTFQYALTLSKDASHPDRLRQIFTDSEVPFSNDDYSGWASCLTTYTDYGETYSTPLYNDWTSSQAGDGNIDYGVIDYNLPQGGKVALISDWGTGLSDAQALLQDIVNLHSPSAIVHLGDIYYSGTPDECSDAFQQIIENVYSSGRNIPVFTIPGNHDYYDYGVGFYGMIPDLNSGIPSGSTQSAVQQASYFCLRTTDSGGNSWQFLAMDTGFNDSDPYNLAKAWVAGPGLQSDEVTWHQDKLTTFSGTTILLSHHQLFSTNYTINGDVSAYSYTPYLNVSLFDTFSDYFSQNVAIWLWGHEHNFVAFQDNLWGLSKGRLIGCSAYEEFVSADPYAVNYPQVPTIDYQLGTTTTAGQAFYNHAYAVIDFSASPVTITYYQYPAFYTGSPPSGGSTVIFSEDLSAPNPPSQGPVVSGTTVNLLGQEALYVSPMSDEYPTLNASLSSAVGLTITAVDASVTDLTDGDVVTIQTTETGAGGYVYLQVPELEDCFYVQTSSSNPQWVVKKKSTANGTTINMYDAACFVVRSTYGTDSEQVLCSSLGEDGFYMSTTDGSATPTYYWRLMPVQALA